MTTTLRRTTRGLLGGALLGSGTFFAAPAAALCIPAELADAFEGEVEICPEEPACPCFSEADVTAALADLDPYAYAWNRRPWGVTDQTSLRGDAWECGPDGWSAPTAGFDTFAETAECGTTSVYYCETWTDTWQAAPHHSWAGDGESVLVEVSAADFAACEALLLDWIDAGDVPMWSW